MLLAAGCDFYFCIGLASQSNKPHFTYDYTERGRLSGMPSLEAKHDLAKPIRIRLQRRGRFVSVAHRQEGGEWSEFYPLNFQSWPAKIQVGFEALNTSAVPFTAVFSDFKLTRDTR